MRHRQAPSGPEALAARYLAGLTLRQLGAEIGVCHTTVLYHLRKLRGYPDMVTRMLLARIKAAGETYTVTPARESRRRLKHTLAMLRQKRPAIYAQMIDRSRPKRCPECSRQINAHARRGMWAWSCSHCGAGDFAPIRAIVTRRLGGSHGTA